MPNSHSVQNQLPEAYTISIHSHRLAAWAAGRAASTSKVRFKVQQAIKILESSGFNSGFSYPQNLPQPEVLDDWHRISRAEIIKRADSLQLTFSHGVAAKLLNIYLKVRFVCGGWHEHPKVQALHPPIDSVLLTTLARANIGGFKKEWRELAKLRWTNFKSNDYDFAISLIRRSIPGLPLWGIEEHWRGHQ
jgi:hypothetical protein